MELKSLDIDRMLEALGPTLKAELDRVMQEAQLRFEKEFEQKLRDAMRDAETTARQTVDGRLEKAVAEAKEAARKEVATELEAQFTRTLQETTARLREQWDSDRVQLQEELAEWRIFADAPRQLGEATAQAEILLRFLGLAERFAPSLAIYISRSDALSLWKTRGSAIFPQKIATTAGSEFFLREIVVRDKVIAAVCAARPYKLDALDYLTAALQSAIELFGMRLRNPAPATRSIAAAAGADGARPPQKDNVQ